jgi:D-cysteine desulfhydrase/L-cysteate sulfo-lyase
MIDFGKIDRVHLCHAPTPLEAMPRLSETLGCNVFVKRDDCTGLAGGGNKTRKLEYLLADAKNNDADTLITIGGIQSNHARQTAAAAAKFGFDCHLVLEDVIGTPKKDYYHNGNVLLDQICGAVIHQIDDDKDCVVFAEQLKSQLISEGKKPYLIPVGGSNEIGSLGYIRCAKEIATQINKQEFAFDHIILATGSAGTQAGLLAGLITENIDIPVLGICVSRETQAQNEIVQDLLEKTLSHIGLPIKLAQDSVFTDGSYYGEGYGITTQATIDAVRQCAQLEGLLLDPVYTGKGMAGLIDLAKQGRLGKNILFLHTGGSQGLFAYSDVL